MTNDEIKLGCGAIVAAVQAQMNVRNRVATAPRPPEIVEREQAAVLLIGRLVANLFCNINDIAAGRVRTGFAGDGTPVDFARPSL